MSDLHNQRIARIATESFADLLGIKLVTSRPDHVVVRMPYRTELGIGRIHGGAISALIDVAATASFWSDPDLKETAMGATVGFTVNFLKLAVNSDLTATARVRRRGGTLCTGDVTVTNDTGDEVAMAVVTYKLTQ